MQDDQPRPDLDAAIDAVLPSLTSVSDEAIEASLRRTRAALAGTESRRAGTLGRWRWAFPAATAVVAAIAAIAAIGWWPATPVESPRVVISDGPAPVTLAPLLPQTSVVVSPVVTAPVPVAPSRIGRATRVAATSMTPVKDAPRPDPLIALVRAVQAIPEAAWRAGVARVDSPVAVPEIELAPIDTPPVGDKSTEPIAPGEP
jgi:hypothetical protein